MLEFGRKVDSKPDIQAASKDLLHNAAPKAGGARLESRVRTVSSKKLAEPEGEECQIPTHAISELWSDVASSPKSFLYHNIAPQPAPPAFLSVRGPLAPARYANSKHRIKAASADVPAVASGETPLHDEIEERTESRRVPRRLKFRHRFLARRRVAAMVRILRLASDDGP